MTHGRLLRDARRRHNVSQQQLAIRAGTTQSAISRIESAHGSPSVETLRALLYLLGEDLELGSARRDTGIDITLNRERLRQTPAERVAYGLAFANQAIAISPNVRHESGTA